MTRYKKSQPRDRFGRARKYSPDFARYEKLKREWIAANPGAISSEYELAIKHIALKCGI